MELKKLKELLESNAYKPSTIIFECNDKFIPLQYIAHIVENNLCEINYLESIEELPQSTSNIFSDESEESNVLNIIICDSLDYVSYEILSNNVWVITKSIDKDVNYFYNTYLIKLKMKNSMYQNLQVHMKKH